MGGHNHVRTHRGLQHRVERLTCNVRRANGQAYAHVCTLGVFEAVVGYLDDHLDEATTSRTIWEALGLPMTQVQVALSFLAENGLLRRRGKMLRPVGPNLYEEVLEHFHYLAEGP